MLPHVPSISQLIAFSLFFVWFFSRICSLFWMASVSSATCPGQWGNFFNRKHVSFTGGHCGMVFLSRSTRKKVKKPINIINISLIDYMPRVFAWQGGKCIFMVGFQQQVACLRLKTSSSISSSKSSLVSPSKCGVVPSVWLLNLPGTSLFLVHLGSSSGVVSSASCAPAIDL